MTLVAFFCNKPFVQGRIGASIMKIQKLTVENRPKAYALLRDLGLHDLTVLGAVEA